MIKKKGAGKILLETTLAGAAATGATAQSTTSVDLMNVLKNNTKTPVNSVVTKVNNAIKEDEEKVSTKALVKMINSVAWVKSVWEKLNGRAKHPLNNFDNESINNRNNYKNENSTVVKERESKNSSNTVEKDIKKSNLSESKENCSNNKVETSNHHSKNETNPNPVKEDNNDFNSSKNKNIVGDISKLDNSTDFKNEEEIDKYKESIPNIVHGETPTISEGSINDSDYLKVSRVINTNVGLNNTENISSNKENIDGINNVSDSKSLESLTFFGSNLPSGNSSYKKDEKQSDFSREFDESDKNSLILSKIIDYNVVPPNYEVLKNISANEKNYDVNNEKNFDKFEKEKNTIDKKTKVNLDSTLKSEDDLDESGNWLENSNILMTDENRNSIPAIEKNDEYHGNYHEPPDDSSDKKADFNKDYYELDDASEKLYDDLDLNLALGNSELSLEEVLDKTDEDENNSNEKIEENFKNENNNNQNAEYSSKSIKNDNNGNNDKNNTKNNQNIKNDENNYENNYENKEHSENENKELKDEKSFDQIYKYNYEEDSELLSSSGQVSKLNKENLDFSNIVDDKENISVNKKNINENNDKNNTKNNQNIKNDENNNVNKERSENENKESGLKHKESFYRLDEDNDEEGSEPLLSLSGQISKLNEENLGLSNIVSVNKKNFDDINNDNNSSENSSLISSSSYLDNLSVEELEKKEETKKAKEETKKAVEELEKLKNNLGKLEKINKDENNSNKKTEYSSKSIKNDNENNNENNDENIVKKAIKCTFGKIVSGAGWGISKLASGASSVANYFWNSK